MTEAASTSLVYRENNNRSSPVFQSVMRLLSDIFGLNVDPIKTFDVFEPSYRSFSYLGEGENCIANVSTIDLPLFISGIPVKAMGIQSVATRPSYRQRGLSHDLLRRALSWCDDRAGLVLLHTSIPDFYLPFGFRIVDEHYFVGTAPESVGEACAYELSWESPKDRGLLKQMLLARGFTSKVVSVCGMPGMFILNAIGTEGLHLYHLPALQVIIAIQRRADDTLCLLDIVGQSMPRLSQILGALGCSPERIKVHFSPDLLGWKGVAAPCQKKTVLMARGELNVDSPFMLQPTLAF